MYKKILTILTILIFAFPSFSSATLADGLVGWWPFDVRDYYTSTLVLDRSGSKNGGTLVNSPALVGGRLGQALSFNGATNYVQVTDSDSLSFNQSFSISFWIYPVSLSNDPVLVGKGRWSTQGEYQLQLTSGKLNLTIEDGVKNTAYIGRTTAAQSASFLNKWHHIVATYNGSGASTGITLYIDNVAQTTADASGGAFTAMGNLNADLLIGALVGLSVYDFKGSIDDVRIYNRALSAAEINQIYRQGLTKNY
jgi:hypothetical protein